MHYRLTIEGIEHHLELYPNHQLLSPGAVLEKRRTSKTKKSLDNVDFKKIRDTQCHYHGNAGNQNEKCALSTCYGLVSRTFYLIYLFFRFISYLLIRCFLF